MGLIDTFKILLTFGGAKARYSAPFESTPPGACDAVWDVYQRLNGIQSRDAFDADPEPWDLSVDGLLVELDDQRHFNRYRLCTLASPIYAQLTFPLREYRDWCVTHERTLRSGIWTNEACERLFGPAGPEKGLTPLGGAVDVADIDVSTGTGSPCLRQRALHDFVKDAWVLCSDVRASRVSVWDFVEVHGELTTVYHWLKQGLPLSKHDEPAVCRALRDLVHARAIGRR